MHALWTAAATALEQGEAKDREGLRSLVASLRADGVFAKTFSAELSQLRVDPKRAPRGSSPGCWTQYEDDRIVATWELQPRPIGNALLVGTAHAAYVAADLSVPVQVRRYQTDRPIRFDTFDPDVRLRITSEIALGELYVSRSESGLGHALEFVCERPVPVLRIARRQRELFLWDFDRATLAPRLLCPSDSFAARRRLMLEFLIENGRPGADVLAEQMLDAPEYFLRWAGMQAIAGRHPERTREVLERGCLDEHPEIEAASRRALQQLTEA